MKIPDLLIEIAKNQHIIAKQINIIQPECFVARTLVGTNRISYTQIIVVNPI